MLYIHNYGFATGKYGNLDALLQLYIEQNNSYHSLNTGFTVRLEFNWTWDTPKYQAADRFQEMINKGFLLI